jgi:hypothetical protein
MKVEKCKKCGGKMMKDHKCPKSKMEDMLEKMTAELSEETAAVRKRKHTEAEHFGKKNVKAASKLAEKLKGKKGIDNPFALSKYMVYRKHDKVKGA